MNTYSYRVKFETPDNVDDENVRHILSQFFADLEQTDRIITARIQQGNELSEDDIERLLSMLDLPDDEVLDMTAASIDELLDE